MCHQYSGHSGMLSVLPAAGKAVGGTGHSPCGIWQDPGPWRLSCIWTVPGSSGRHPSHPHVRSAVLLVCGLFCHACDKMAGGGILREKQNSGNSGGSGVSDSVFLSSLLFCAGGGYGGSAVERAQVPGVKGLCVFHGGSGGGGTGAVALCREGCLSR